MQYFTFDKAVVLFQAKPARQRLKRARNGSMFQPLQWGNIWERHGQLGGCPLGTHPAKNALGGVTGFNFGVMQSSG